MENRRGGKMSHITAANRILIEMPLQRRDVTDCFPGKPLIFQFFLACLRWNLTPHQMLMISNEVLISLS